MAIFLAMFVCFCNVWLYIVHILSIYVHKWLWEVLFFSSMRATGRGAGGSAAGCRAHRWKKQKWASSLLIGVGSGGPCLGLAVLGQKCDFWKVLGLARNPSKKMRLDESFRMVQSACHFVAYIKSYGQKTKVIVCGNFACSWNCNG